MSLSPFFFYLNDNDTSKRPPRTTRLQGDITTQGYIDHNPLLIDVRRQFNCNYVPFLLPFPGVHQMPPNSLIQRLLSSKLPTHLKTLEGPLGSLYGLVRANSNSVAHFSPFGEQRICLRARFIRLAHLRMNNLLGRFLNHLNEGLFHTSSPSSSPSP